MFDLPLTDAEVVTNVRDFGAAGDGVAGDSAVILRSVETTKNGALLFPTGRYMLRDGISIARPNVVLRGDGPDKSVVRIPQLLMFLH